MPLRRIEHTGEVVGHDLGRGQGFADVGRQFFAVDAGGDFVDGVGLERGFARQERIEVLNTAH
jgi:hypothetical protein